MKDFTQTSRWNASAEHCLKNVPLKTPKDAYHFQQRVAGEWYMLGGADDPLGQPLHKAPLVFWDEETFKIARSTQLPDDHILDRRELSPFDFQFHAYPENLLGDFIVEGRELKTCGVLLDLATDPTRVYYSALGYLRESDGLIKVGRAWSSFPSENISIAALEPAEREMVNTWMFANQVEEAQQTERVLVPTGKKKKGRPTVKPIEVRYISLPLTSQAGRKSTSEEPTENKLTTRHVVRAHWRNQAYGLGRRQRKLRWIPTHVKGPADAPFVHRVYHANQEKRTA